MGRKLGAVLIGLGVLLIVLGLMMKFYAYDRLAVAPLNQKSVSYSEATGATIFSIADQAEVTKDLLTTVNVVGDVEAGKAATEEAGDQVNVWEKVTYTDEPTFDVDSGEPPLSGSHQRIAFDAHTGVAVECCDTYFAGGADLETNEEDRDYDVAFEGQLVKFPFNTQKRSYDYFDTTLGEGVPMQYTGEESLEGLNTYMFESVIPPTEYATLTAPASIFGIDEEGDVDLARVYSNTRTLWIEPETGVIMRSREDVDTFAEYDGERVATLTQALSEFPESQIRRNVEDYRSKSVLLKAARTWFPWVGGIVGLLALLAGLLLTARSRDRVAPTHAATSHRSGATV